jgi:hypothetical protein
VNGLCPNFVTDALALVKPSIAEGGKKKRAETLRKEGWASRSMLAPSLLTRGSDAAAARNNELPSDNGSIQVSTVRTAK